MSGKFLTDLGAELAPAAHPAQRIVLSGHLEAEGGQRLAAGE